MIINDDAIPRDDIACLSPGSGSRMRRRSLLTMEQEKIRNGKEWMRNGNEEWMRIENV